MLTRTVRFQLLAFFVIAVVSIVYALIRFTDVEGVFGDEGYTAKLELQDSGGIFTNAEVTYRGVQVGKIGDLRLTKTGLEVDLDIDADAPDIPSDLDAVVANRSAVGEQFVDLRPRAAGGPTLRDRPVIPVDRGHVPVSTDKVISALDTFATSVPTDSLRTVVDELDTAFTGTGQDLQVLLDSTATFTDAAAEHLPQTIQLIDSSGTVLATVNRQSGNIKAFAGDLKLLAGQLKTSDPDLRKLISVTPGAAEQLDRFVRESGPGLSVTLANLLTTSNILLPRQDGIEQALVTYPAVAVGSKTVTPGDGTAHLGLALNLFDPPPCVKGYEGTKKKAGNDESNTAPNDQAYCAEPKGSPIAVRGSQNAPYGGRPVDVSQGDVSANVNRPQESLAQQAAQRGGGQQVTLTSLGSLLGMAG
jgi:phospholipid/cholesterol/gamma-HCH transport system substrate-binding protein